MRCCVTARGPNTDQRDLEVGSRICVQDGAEATRIFPDGARPPLRARSRSRKRNSDAQRSTSSRNGPQTSKKNLLALVAIKSAGAARHNDNAKPRLESWDY